MLRWGIIGTGNIAHTFAKALQVAEKGQLVAVGSRSIETAQKFAQEFGIEYSFGSYNELLAFDQVDIVYISTPHPQHYELALAAAKAGKHMLVEKPMAMTEAHIKSILETAKEYNVFVMEAYMYRCHPQTLKVVELIQSGAIGQVKMIRANFLYDGRPLGNTSRLWINELGGGAIMDIGGYPMSFCRLVAGVANSKSVQYLGGGANPIKIKATGYIQPDTNVDEWSNASLEFEGNITAQLFTGIFADSDCSGEVWGSKGSIKITNLWRPDLAIYGPVRVEFTEYGKEPKIIPVKQETNLYAYEADAVADAIAQCHHECEYMNWQDTLGQAHAMDAWRKEIGLKYKEDQ
ncbi:hypothetical protein BD408DRAFT_448283 [Parasitella parasitica]|nr:hypothetical protein BD408DRAFT_448283 [Parasitella parasitica]